MTTDFHTWHVSSTQTNPIADGKSQATAFNRIQQALDAAQAGDTVLIHGGVYPEFLTLNIRGTADKPIRIVADRVAENHVIVTGANPAIRSKTQSWECVHEDKLLYRTPLRHRPTRVLADHVDLLAYPTVDDLKAFTFLKSNYPGHEHGFAFDPNQNMLYVRLRADKRYNTSTNPNDLSMAVSPKPGVGKYGNEPSGQTFQNLLIPYDGSAHVIIDGITFETPGIAAVFTEADDVVVRNCWFYGCRTGVGGPRERDPQKTANRVTVEHCLYTQFPTYMDEKDTIEREKAVNIQREGSYQHLMHWQRKGNYPNGDGVGRPWGYEVGLTLCMGRDWVVKNNYIHDAFEGISASGISWSRNARIMNNRFERICDNAVESENHAFNLTVAGNLIIDCFEPFSWQPLDGGPLPGPMYIYNNIVWQTPQTTALWNLAGNWPGLLKIGGKTHYWAKVSDTPITLEIPGGLWLFNNTMIRQRGRIFTWLNDANWPISNVHVVNNHIITWRLVPSASLDRITVMHMDHNLVQASDPIDGDQVDTHLAKAAGKHGQWISTPGVPASWSNLDTRGITPMTRQAITEAGLPTDIPFAQRIGASELNIQAGPQVDQAR
ncbi:MAG: hypothetical protein CMJ19_05005 [Phycisphaeraceae bacterium]|nr:hypothetical protein [Phycisphaeraceae bacterium]